MSESALPNTGSAANQSHILSFALMHSHQQLLRLSVSAILHSLRISKVPRSILDLLSQVMAAFLQRLLQRLSAMALVEGRYRLSSGEDGARLVDLFISADRLFVGGYSPMLTMEPGWKLPPFELEQLLDYAHHQQRVVSGVKRRTEQEYYSSVYEEAGLINPQYALIPVPAARQPLAIILCDDDAEDQQT